MPDTDQGIPQFWRGVAYRRSSFLGTPVADHIDSTIISADLRTPFTITHEIGHILIDMEHHGDVWNLMKSGTSAADSVIASKRLQASQKSDIDVKRPNIVVDYIP